MTPQRKATLAKWRARPEVRARLKEQQVRYDSTPKAKKTRRKYRMEHGRPVREAYAKSAKGKAVMSAVNKKRRKCDLIRKNTPESKHQMWRRSLERRYNFSEAEYEAMLAEQHGVCAICEKPESGKGPSGKRLHVDHDHVTGKVRGLLCARCNLTLGFWNDDAKRFVRAADYLLQTQGQPSPN